MSNQVDYSIAGLADLNRLKAAAADPDEVELPAAQIESCLEWYDPRLDPDTTANCGPVAGAGLLSAPHHTARMIEVYPLRFFFEIDDTAQPYIMTVVRVEWVLRAVDPTTP